MSSDTHLIESFAESQLAKRVGPSSKRINPSTIRTRVRNLKHVDQQFRGLRHLTTRQLQDWMISRSYKPNTVRAYRDALVEFYKWLVQCDVITKSPIEDFVPPSPPPGGQQRITTPELEYTLANSNRQVKLWIALGAYQGLNCQAIAALTADHLDRTEKPPTLFSIPGDRSTASVIRPEVLNALDEIQLPRRGRLFPHATGSSVSQRINRRLHALGMKSTAMSLVWWHRDQVHRYGADFGLNNAGSQQLVSVDESEERILSTLEEAIPSAGISYRQGLWSILPSIRKGGGIMAGSVSR